VACGSALKSLDFSTLGFPASGFSASDFSVCAGESAPLSAPADSVNRKPTSDAASPLGLAKFSLRRKGDQDLNLANTTSSFAAPRKFSSLDAQMISISLSEQSSSDRSSSQEVIKPIPSAKFLASVKFLAGERKKLSVHA
jgi:hypothetical protein